MRAGAARFGRLRIAKGSQSPTLRAGAAPVRAAGNVDSEPASSLGVRPRSVWIPGGVVLAAGLVAGVGGLWFGLALAPDAMNRLRDDAFYEFTWAANVAAGRGPTVSDGVITSGVQLLWTLLLVPLAWLAGPAALPGIAPWLGFGLHAATAGLWYRAAPTRVAGGCLAACWLGHPLLVRESQNGQETALACLLATVLWLSRRAGERAFCVWSVLAVLARSDLWLLVACLSAWRHRRQWWCAVPTPALALLLHFGANLALGGGVVPDSALPMAWLWHENQELADPSGASWLARQWWFLRPALLGGPFATATAMGCGYCVFRLVRPWWPAGARAVPAVGVGALSACGMQDLGTPAWTALLLAILPASQRRRLPWSLLALAIGLGGIVVLHWAVRWYPRDYYVAPLVVAAFAALAQHGRLRLVLLLFASSQLFQLANAKPEPLAGQIELEMAGEQLANVLPGGERVGSFNSGIITFHAAVLANGERRRAVVNLDGVVDHRAFAALRQGALAAWLDQQRIRFVLDNPVQFLTDPRLPHANGHWLAKGFDPARDLREIARFDALAIDNGRPGGESLRLYWRTGSGEPPRLAGASRDLGIGRDGARYVVWVAQAGQTLQCEEPSGQREDLLTVEVDTIAFLRLQEDPHRACRLFVAGQTAPVLELPPL